MIRPVKPSDTEKICGIYNYYVLHAVATFEETAVSVADMQARIDEITARHPWLVYEENGVVSGYAYAGYWKSRAAYRYSVEISVYTEHGNHSKGLGSKLYEALLALLEQAEVHAVIGGIALPNDACIALHQKFGFEKVAQFKETGFKFGKWIDVTYWEKILAHK